MQEQINTANKTTTGTCHVTWQRQWESCWCWIHAAEQILRRTRFGIAWRLHREHNKIYKGRTWYWNGDTNMHQGNRHITFVQILRRCQVITQICTNGKTPPPPPGWPIPTHATPFNINNEKTNRGRYLGRIYKAEEKQGRRAYQPVGRISIYMSQGGISIRDFHCTPQPKPMD